MKKSTVTHIFLIVYNNVFIYTNIYIHTNGRCYHYKYYHSTPRIKIIYLCNYNFLNIDHYKALQKCMKCSSGNKISPVVILLICFAIILCKIIIIIHNLMVLMTIVVMTIMMIKSICSLIYILYML